MKQSPQLIEQRLDELVSAGTVESFVRHDYHDVKRPSRMFEARWRPEKDVIVRARMMLTGFDDGPLSTWEIIAEASKPWDWSWPSPATMFWPKPSDLSWDLAGARALFRYRTANPVDSAASTREAVRAALDAQADIHVLTIDDELQDRDRPLMPLVRYLPASFVGRLVEHRVAPWALTAVNRELKPLGLRLPPAGALIVPQRPRPAQIRPADLVIAEARFSLGRPQALIDAVIRHAPLPRHAGPDLHRHVSLLREQFTLTTDQEAVEDLEEGLDAAEAQLAAALQAQERLRGELAETSALLHAAQQEVQIHRTRETEALEAVEEARAALAEAHAAHEQLLTTVATSDLGQALRDAEARRDAAESEAETAEDLLDEQAREIAWLRSQLAAAGQPSEGPPPQGSHPATWEELVERAASELDRIVLGDVLATVRPLRGHTAEATWRQRTWEALRALDAYARAKTEHGPELLPHLTAYLSWKDAPVPLPRSRYSATESQLVLNTPKLREERMLPVPREVHPSGRVLMAEHIRIGSGKPPAPRLHLYDNTSGNGRIYVGHIGEHLRNSRTN
ncbi:hypothetical protein ACFFSH_31415 [Streptomyces filamentosus]|uniref:Uncharacterized protein n=1 Tax=Streptomyces filamentosus TaxID=67294 RepID=A0A919EPS3_STRFL|nr:hypothetical protein [Streptomyces filamentosus]GHG13107.1 hypothetical protein GCM10017667_53520 [Streptomyces filamentosus]